MAKLYWRVKRATTSEGRGGYWTWVPAEVIPMFTTNMRTAVKPYVEEEE